jgi:hypothetical protein
MDTVIGKCFMEYSVVHMRILYQNVYWQMIEMLNGTDNNFIAFFYSQQRLMSCSINTKHENLKRFMAWFPMTNVLTEMLHRAEHNNYLGKSKLKKIYISVWKQLSYSLDDTKEWGFYQSSFTTMNEWINEFSFVFFPNFFHSLFNLVLSQ